MTEVESYAHPMPFRDEQPPVASVEVKDTESPVLRVVVGEEHAVYSTRLNFRYTVGQLGGARTRFGIDKLSGIFFGSLPLDIIRSRCGRRSWCRVCVDSLSLRGSRRKHEYRVEKSAEVG